MSKSPIVFIHGLWMHSGTWQPWMQYFTEHGYTCYNPDWPGDGATVEASRANPGPIADHRLREVVDGYVKAIESLSQPPILIGHSFGGLIVQILLGEGKGVAGIAIDPAPIKGVWQLPWSALKASSPVLGNPFNISKAVSLTYSQFRYAFANTLPEDEARQLYDRWTVPSPARPLFQVAFATMNPSAENKVNTSNEARGPLLITSGDKDHIVPPVLCKAAWKKYAKSKAVTDFKSFEGRGHSLAIDHGWKEIAEYGLKWLEEKGL